MMARRVGELQAVSCKLRLRGDALFSVIFQFVNESESNPISWSFIVKTFVGDHDRNFFVPSEQSSCYLCHT